MSRIESESTGEHTGPSQTAPNALAAESSPYLLQHAQNPVQWRPWGREALSVARETDRPIFLSVGYSTCFWCHVMERESFESPAVAMVLNDHFVPIKVDREERPDVDDVYMAAVQLTTGQGGWPMSVWLTPPGARGPADRGLEPFYAGTYFPIEGRWGRPGFLEVLHAISEAWRTRRAEVLEQAATISRAVREHFSAPSQPVVLGAGDVGKAVATLLRMHDREFGGFGSVPKFPQPVFCRFLLDVRDSIEDPAVREQAGVAVRRTLDRMALGGIFDHLGGGFHRYSTDQRWIVPHFEKMLYDNGQLTELYALSFAVWRDPLHARTVRATCDYVLREMTHPDSGAFFSAQDAEVDHREGLNYLWRAEEIERLLEPDDARIFARAYGIDQGPNFRDPHHPEDPPANVLFLIDRPEAIASGFGLSEDELERRLAASRDRLFEERSRRRQPALDDKIITGWNGLMIAGLAHAAAALAEPKYLAAADRAARWIVASMRAPDGRLLRACRNGPPRIDAFLEDYAMLVHGLLALWRCAEGMGRRDDWSLRSALELVERARSEFRRDSDGAWFDAPEAHAELIVRTRSSHDGAVPCAAGFMLHNLLDLHDLTGRRECLADALQLLASMSGDAAHAPVGCLNTIRAVHRLLAVDPALLGETAAAHAPAARDVPVRIFAGVDRVGVPGNASAELPLRFEIDPGYHIYAPGSEMVGSSAADIRIEGGGGLVAEVSWPAATRLMADSTVSDGAVPLVYRGTFEVRVTLRRVGAWTGRPMIVVRYQPCTETSCLAPIEVELDVAIDPV